MMENSKKISKKDVEDIIALTPMQEGMLFHYLNDLESDLYFEQLSLTLSGKIDIEKMKTAWQFVAQNNEILRTVFRWEGLNKPIQIVLKEKNVSILEEDYSKIDCINKAERVEELRIRDRKKRIDISTEPYRISICKLDEDKCEMIISNHHILYDGWSNGILLKEFLEAYHSLLKCRKLIKPKKNKLKNVIKWQQQKDKGEEYWSPYLNGFTNDKELFKENDKKSILNVPQNYSYVFPKNFAYKILDFTKKQGITMASLLYTAWGILLQRYKDTDDVAFGTTISGREAEMQGIENMVGLFINTIPLRISSKSDEKIENLLGKVNRMLIEREDFQTTSLSQIKAFSEIGNKEEIFDSIVVIENYPLDKILLNNQQNDLVIENYRMFEYSNYNLTLKISAFSNIELHFIYNCNMFSYETIERMSKHFYNIVNGIINKTKLSEIEILSKEEKTKLLFDFNNTKPEYSKYTTVPQLFQQQVAKTPDNIAVTYENKNFTYKEINSKANEIAGLLRQRGVNRDSVIGILMERSVDILVGIIGIMKAGGAYLPIYPMYPKERIDYMLEDSNVRILLTKKGLLKGIKFEGEVLDCEYEKLSNLNISNPEIVNEPSDLAYIMYTSGSTGKPKGVMVEHKNIIRLVNNPNYIDFKKDDRILQTGAVTFDASTFEIWGAFLNGLRLYLVEEDTILDVDRLGEVLSKNEITISWLTSPLFNQLSLQRPEIFSKVRNLLVGGDVLSPIHINRVREICKNTNIINGYGPTENTTFSTCFLIDKNYEGNIPIGKPISSTKVFILSKNGELQPIGVPGEVYLGGEGVARGYINKPELTKERFIENPFEENERMYRTGDIACWRPDGNIIFLGRVDDQVKIRGFRIELDEIKSQLLKNKAIKDAVVVAKIDEKNNKHICAYFVSDEELNLLQVRKYLKDKLPDYMIPSYFIQLERLPLNPNGKVDRDKLPQPDKSINITLEYVEPRNEVEMKLAKVWEEVLEVEKVGINHNFFDLGGDSIKSIQISAKLHKYGLKMKIKDLLNNPTIKELSRYVRTASREINQSKIEGEVKLTPIQKWFFESRFKDKHHFNQSVMLFNKEGFNEEIIKKVFNRIVEHHDALRMVYKLEEESIIQYNRDLEGKLFDLKVIDLTETKDSIDRIEDEANKVQQSINLENGPLVKLALYKTKVGDRLLIVIHHLVIDGVSWRILLEDFEEAYKQAAKNEEIKLPQKTDSFKDWADKLIDYADSKNLLKEIDYWKQIEEIHIDTLPKDGTDHENKIKDSMIMSMTLSENDTEKLLKKVNKAYNTEINDILLTALGMTIKDWTGKDKVLINLEGHGREEIIKDIDIARTVGWFTSTYPVVLDMGETEEVSYQIKLIKESLRKVPNKGIGYGIMKYLTSEKNIDTLKFNINPEISFNYLGQSDENMQTMMFDDSYGFMGLPVSPDLERQYAIDINGIISEGKLKLTFNYNKNQYRENTIIKLIEGYKNNLLKVITHCVDKEGTELTPSDLGDKRLSIKELEAILDTIGKEIEKIYPLSPMQEGMIFHSLLDKDSSAYFEQTTFEINSKLDIEIFEKSFNVIIGRHDIFRTIFICDKSGNYKQVVLKERPSKISFEDISYLENNEKKEFVEKIKSMDIKRGFNLLTDNLIRISILKLDEESYKIILSFHHIIMDGWCLGIILNELFKIYSSLKENSHVELEKVYPYINYIDWLEKQDKQEAVEYWEKYLEGYEQQATIPKNRSEVNTKYEHTEISFTINEVITNSLKALASENQTTLNTVFQGIWGILLQRYNDTDDVVFGSVVSGRPPEVIGIENMVGIFINTIPVRIKKEKNMTFLELIKK